MPFLRHAPLIVAGLALATVFWVLIQLITERSQWLQVEVPAQIHGGGSVQINVTLKTPLPAGLLCVDLHWKDARGSSRGLLSRGPTRLIQTNQSLYDFDLAVPARPEVESVYGVIFVSPTGRWAERTQACTFDPIAVSPTIAPANTGRRKVAARDQHVGPPLGRDFRPIRWTVALLWALAGIICWRVRRRAGGPAAGPARPGSGRWAGLALACWLAAAWEFSAAEPVLGHLLRRFAVAQGWYDGRHRLQEMLTYGVLVVSFLVAAVAWRRDHAQPVSLVFSGVDAYWCVAAVSFISLHDADAWLATPVFTIPVVQVIKLSTALVAVSGAVRAVLPHRNPAGEAPSGASAG